MYGLAHGPENGANHESDEQVDALVAEEGRQRFGVGPHRSPDCQRLATIPYLAFGCEFSAHVTSYSDDSQKATRIRVEPIRRFWASGWPVGNNPSTQFDAWSPYLTLAPQHECDSRKGQVVLVASCSTIGGLGFKLRNPSEIQTEPLPFFLPNG
jgi:hypothetical protein